MISIASLIQALAYNLKEFVTFNPDGSMKLILDKVPMEVWGKFSKALNTIGYDIRGAQDALELTKKRSKDDGVSVTFSSGDDHIKAFKAAIGKKDLHKPQSNKSIINKAVKMFGITESPDLAGYILDDGRMLNFGDKYGLGRAKDHREIGALFDEDLKGHDAIKRFCELGNIRLHVGGSAISFDIHVRPTSDQMDKMEDLMEQHKKLTVIVSVPGSKEEFNNSPESVLEYIKKKTGY